MRRRATRFHLLVVCSAIGVLGVLAQDQYQNPDFISIDCGAPNDYDDYGLRLHYQTDDRFIDSGENRQITDEHNDQRSKNLRVFPNGTRNCYTLQPDKGKGNKYLIRAAFYYGNYDTKDQHPAFDLHIGTDYWDTVNTSIYYYTEIIHVPKTDDIQVCLINTGNGLPFISSLELRWMDNSLYQADSTTSLFTNWRYNIGGLQTYRYPHDVYDRIWTAKNYDKWKPVNLWNFTSLKRNNDAYQVPVEVLATAQIATDNTSSISLYWKANSSSQWYIYFHFAELEVFPNGQKRHFFLYVNGGLEIRVVLLYQIPRTVPSPSVSASDIQLSIQSTTPDTQYQPILNAIEFYILLEHLSLPTATDDITAVNDIKKVYGIKRDSWQGDPCVPKDFIWEGLQCSYDRTPRIVAVNLSFSKLRGVVADSFSNLLALTSLDLSGNNLSGKIPESFATLPNLKTLNLRGNNFECSIPVSLQKKVNDSTLQLSVDNNTNPCKENSYESKKKRNSFIVPVIAATLCSVAVLLMVIAILWRIKSRNGKGITVTEGAIKSKNRPFTYSQLLKITNNFTTIIGQGGFGKVYLGMLENGSKVAVKMLCRTSQQGYKEFLAEAQLLMIVHHKNLVSLVGYCDDAENMALIYEFMEKGDLRQHLSDKGMDAYILPWNERLRIAVDAAQGLDYLHNGCKPPIVHRDLKTPNILLNENMQAKIADFGLSKAFSAENDSYISTCPAGTPGYLDPEFQISGNLNKKSDVFSFGIILFELITGYPAVMRSANGNAMHILQWVIPIIERGDVQSIVDPRLNGNFSVNSAWMLVEIAMSCIPPTAIQRPDISGILAELKECWDMETTTNRNQRLGSCRRSSAGTLDMMSSEPSYEYTPSAR
ncbi:hypothetical protein SAY87_018233 [Trapa incisa]|uniref:non-specific serine/threonine protein kinase n=1 Tax=Trapa incisa TaxID=236973 RepID=A0AAN7L324_9MYRT|nr:hypothetical protein SAY87_018233 [Trapa incisa]